ncbi:RBPJ-interacting and tubulin-associated protein 1 [Heteronotia binoei]|uniref:RBPJ-interacting and tubulin-associated protein 1 n=1 Tax=Heteronotia binoei TaxID=13085 RepID=UPI0029304600|nr:RBPJ-interacting and tubulin-associated protein 1 [Heteronotia binoei]
MKASVELAVSGIQALQVQRRGRNSYRAKASYVDETLFGSHAERQSSVVEFDPPWVDKQPRPQRPLLWSPSASRCESDTGPLRAPVPPSTPRKKNYRLKSRTPSYCDETLFGTKSGGQDGSVLWMKEDTAKLHPLLWTPPSTSGNHPSLLSCQKEKPLKVIHRETPGSQQTEAFEAQYREHSFWKDSENNSHENNQDVLGWTGYQPIHRVYSASETFQPPKTDSRINRQQDCHLPDASVASPRSRPRSKGVSRSSSARLSRAASSCKPRPPWK